MEMERHRWKERGREREKEKENRGVNRSGVKGRRINRLISSVAGAHRHHSLAFPLLSRSDHAYKVTSP